MHDPAIDYCVRGEGEEVIVQLLDAMNALRSLDTVPALCRRENGSIIEQARDGYIEDLSSLPFPARHLVDMETYFKIAEPQGLRLDGERNVRQAQMTTSRGCPFMCTYCGKNVTWGKSYRTRTSGEVVAEMEHLMTSFGVERFAFQDDNFTADMERAGDICDKIVERNLNITFECPNGLGVNFLSPSLLEKMKAAGCVSFTIAVESANDVTLRRVKKPNYIKLAPPIVQKAKELDIEVRGFFMIGFPGENIDEVNRTVEYARNLDLAVTNFAIVTPLPGTPLYTECVQAGLINETTVDFEDFAYGAFDIKLSEVSVEELKMVRKIEWMRTMFLDRNGEFRGDIRLKRKDVIDELTKGLSVFPENPEMICMHHKAMEFYGSTSIEEAAAVT
jgi:magnesium-protoporphyrin IX monomethyl ester (oxidative) cyclase